ncbi:hypothetical protein IKF43_00185 [Candidatus Saccharibacteria bacterium]|nr:hypothetical protein [Candidatus Saccharibacteria bacterium]
MKKLIIFLGVVCGVSLGVLAPLCHAEEIPEPEEINAEIPELYIKAINPGYTVDGKSNVGEMIEIARKNADTSISLAGATIGYTNSSGNYTVLVEFPEDSWFIGETLLLRLASSPESELAAVNYTKTLAFKAGIELMMGGEVIDEVCWTSKDGCYKEFKSANPTTLVRNLETGEFEHVLEYEPDYDSESYYVEVIEGEGYGAIESQCRGLQFSEILSYYETLRSEQFIEFYNPKPEQILLDGCKLKYKNKYYALNGIVRPEEYFVYYPEGFSLTKNPTNSNTLELVDTDGAVVDKLVYPNGQRKGTAYALIGYDKSGSEIWRTTYAPTPGTANNYQEFRTCEAGKAINEATGNCVKIASIKEKICKEGYYLNILTGRCNKIKTTAEKTCKEGYYLNPETNRCRKIKENKGAEYSLEPENYEEKSSFVALYAVLLVMGLGIVYLVYEFRHEIAKLWRKVCRRDR